MNGFTGENPWEDIQRKYKTLLLVIGLYFLFTFSAYILIYFQYHYWQAWIVPSMILINLFILLLVRFNLQKKKNIIAGSVFVSLIALIYGSNAAVWADLTLFHTISGVVVIILLGRIVLPKTRILWWIICLFFILAMVFVDKYIFYPRLSDANVPWVKEFILAVDSLLILSLWAQVVFEFQVRSIRTRLMFTLILFVLLPVLIVGIVSNTLNARNYQEQSFKHLNTIILIKSDQIETWQNGLLANLSALLPSKSNLSQLEQLIEYSSDPTKAGGNSFEKELTSSFRSFIDESKMFTEFFIMDLQWRVVLSTNPEHNGNVENSRLYFQSDLEKTHFSPIFIDPETRIETQVIAVPIHNNSGEAVAIMAGKVDLTSLTNILNQEMTLGETDELFIVLPNRRLLTPTRFSALVPASQPISSVGIDQALQQSDGQNVYRGHLGYTVTGVYRWLPVMQVALIAEQSQKETLSSASQVGLMTVILMVIGVIVAFSIGLSITGRLINPLIDLANTAERIASGELNLNAEILQDDELGDLSRAFNTMTTQLRNLVTGLELRVLERTRDLERQSEQLKLAVEIAREASAYRQVDEVIYKTVTLIAERFGYEFVGLYLVDERRDFAIMSVVSGNISKDWSTEKRRIRIGSFDPVGISANTGESRIVTDASIGYNSVYLPNIKMRMVLPLKVGQQIIGVLDIQSIDVDKVNQEIMSILQVIVDQVAIAYDSARIFQRMSIALKELELLTGKYTKASWAAARNEFIESGGYEFDGTFVRPLNRRVKNESGIDKNKDLKIPLIIRDDLIGSLDVQFKNAVHDPAFEESLKEIAERLTLLMENARLVMEARSIAAREQQINKITTQIRGSTNMDAILRNAVQELGKAFGSTKTFIKLGIIPNVSSTSSENEDSGER